jgi:hypothetical protein
MQMTKLNKLLSIIGMDTKLKLINFCIITEGEGLSNCCRWKRSGRHEPGAEEKRAEEEHGPNDTGVEEERGVSVVE